MIVTAWNNGAHARNGSGYGFRVAPEDRDEFFQKDWKNIVLELEGEDQPVELDIPADSFWSENGHDLQHPAVGKWLRKNGLAPWPRGNPPTFRLTPMDGNRFQVEKPLNRGGKRSAI